MSQHVEEDLLVTLGAAIDWQVNVVLQHLTSCSTCRERLGDLARLRRELRQESAPDPDFTDRVLEAVREDERARGARRLRWLAPLNPALAAITTVFAVRLGASTGPGTGAGWVLAVAGAVAVATWWWERRTPRSVAVG